MICSQLYKRARYYDPTNGEFLSPDPLEYVDGLSRLRGYFPPGITDPTGETTCDDNYSWAPVGTWGDLARPNDEQNRPRAECEQLITDLFHGPFGSLIDCAIEKGCLFDRKRVMCQRCDELAAYVHDGGRWDRIEFCYNNFNGEKYDKREYIAFEE